jgi:hypothetical protein
MDEANQELRVTIKKIWPLQAKKVLDLIIPPDNGMYSLFRKQKVKKLKKKKKKKNTERNYEFLTLTDPSKFFVSIYCPI